MVCVWGDTSARTKLDKMIFDFDAFFDLMQGMQKGDTPMHFGADFTSKYNNVAAHPVEDGKPTSIHAEVLGYLLVRFLGVTKQRRSNILTRAGSMALPKVRESIGFLYADGIGGGGQKAYGAGRSFGAHAAGQTSEQATS